MVHHMCCLHLSHLHLHLHLCLCLQQGPYSTSGRVILPTVCSHTVLLQILQRGSPKSVSCRCFLPLLHLWVFCKCCACHDLLFKCLPLAWEASATIKRLLLAARPTKPKNLCLKRSSLSWNTSMLQHKSK